MRKSNRDESMTDTFRNMMGRADMKGHSSHTVRTICKAIQCQNSKVMLWWATKLSEKMRVQEQKGQFLFKTTPRTKAWLWMHFDQSQKQSPWKCWVLKGCSICEIKIKTETKKLPLAWYWEKETVNLDVSTLLSKVKVKQTFSFRNMSVSYS